MKNDLKKCEILVVGGGLSGLSATWQLRKAAIDTTLLEARDRVGGRVLTVSNDSGNKSNSGGKAADCDLGPSWIWPGQPLVANVLKQLAIATYEQYSAGQVLYQLPNGDVHVAPESSPMADALRIEGGVGNLTTSLAREIDTEHLLLSHVAKSVSQVGDLIEVTCETPAGPRKFVSQKLAIAMPPRLALQLDFSPELPTAVTSLLAATPTWMAGHAKFFAVYDQPFWRNKGFAGSAFSRRGPLAEIHDASPLSGQRYCLFGFVGLDAPSRASLGEESLKELAIGQLTAIFGEEAASPVETHYQDWSQEPFTAAETDRVPQTRHPQYGMDIDVGSQWRDRLFFLGSEAAHKNGGLIEGALEAARLFVGQVSNSSTNQNSTPSSYWASMGWDWI